jgi:REP element-mobilizing transposase RayT
MPQSLSQIYVHLVFSTKDRKPWLCDDSMRDQLHAYMAKVLRDNVDSPALVINSVEDHVHALIRLSRRFAVMKVVQECKVATSKWLKRQRRLANFAWQSAYGAFSVSASKTEQVKTYILNQHQHHQRVSFQDEFRELCRRHRLALDERYVWG